MVSDLSSTNAFFKTASLAARKLVLSALGFSLDELQTVLVLHFSRPLHHVRKRLLFDLINSV